MNETFTQGAQEMNIEHSSANPHRGYGAPSVNVSLPALFFLFFFFVLQKAAGPIPHPTLCALLSEIAELLAKLRFMVAAELTKPINKGRYQI